MTVPPNNGTNNKILKIITGAAITIVLSVLGIGAIATDHEEQTELGVRVDLQAGELEIQRQDLRSTQKKLNEIKTNTEKIKVELKYLREALSDVKRLVERNYQTR